MKVLYLTNQYPKPSHTFIRREIHGVEAAGVEVERVSIRESDEPLVDEVDRAERERTRVILEHGIAGLLLPTLATFATHPARFLRALKTAFELGRRSPRGIARHFAYVGEACVLLRLARRSGAEHVHAHFATNPTAVALLCRELGGPPFSFTAHGTADLSSSGATATLARKIERATFAIAVCHAGRRQLALHAPAGHEHKIHVVGCSVDPSFFATEPERVPETSRLVCVARLSPEKEHATLLRAARIVADEGIPFELSLIGDGPERAALRVLAGALDLSDRVRFEGWKSGADVRARIADSRALVLASSSEGLPVVIMEAFAMGRPVVSTDAGGICELVESGQSGWVVPSRSPKALARAMREVLRCDVARLDTMGRHGAARVVEAHDSRRQGQVVAQLFSANRANPRPTGILAQ